MDISESNCDFDDVVEDTDDNARGMLETTKTTPATAFTDEDGL